MTYLTFFRLLKMNFLLFAFLPSTPDYLIKNILKDCVLASDRGQGVNIRSAAVSCICPVTTAWLLPLAAGHPALPSASLNPNHTFVSKSALYTPTYQQKSVVTNLSTADSHVTQQPWRFGRCRLSEWRLSVNWHLS